MVVLNQKIIHRQPAGSAVSIRKWVDILKLRMEICRGRQGIFICNSLNLFKKLVHLFLYILCRCADLFSACHIVVQLVGARPLTELVSPGIV